MNNKGQAILSEYTMIFFVVIAALVTMTIFVQRGLQARVHDARNFMIDSAMNACDANCMAATGNVSYEYEPYYTQMLSDVQQNDFEKTGTAKSVVNWSIGSVYTKSLNATTQSISTSIQLPPQCAGYPNGGCPNQ